MEDQISHISQYQMNSRLFSNHTHITEVFNHGTGQRFKPKTVIG